MRAHLRSPRGLVVAVVLLTAIVACGGKEDGRTDGPDEVGEPVRGGSVTYGIEAETGGGWCLGEAQLAISGILVARSIYDTLTAPNADGEYVPYLAEAVEHSDDYTEWTITVRDGVTFHDGSPLTAEVVKNNIDAARGAPGDHERSALLGIFQLANIDTVEVIDERDVVVTTKVPWVAFDAFLYGSGRFGMMAQAQLDDTESCNTDLIGTGPFMLEDPSDWEQGRQLRAVRNPDYWQIAPDGEPYPYLDEIVFEPITEPEQRINALLAGDVQLIHLNSPDDLIEGRELVEAGDARAAESDARAEVSFTQVNTSVPPFDDVRVRRAMALAYDRDSYQETVLKGQLTLANGPFAPGSPAFLEDTGYPAEPDLDEARRLIEEYEGENGPMRTLEILLTPGPQDQPVFLQQSLAELGIEVDLTVVQQDALIDRAVSGDYDLMAFRNYPGGDPDELYSWFYSGSPINFSRIDDPDLDALLDAGRSETDLSVRDEIYRDVNRRLGEQVYSLWTSFTTWMVLSGTGVHGYDPETAPPVPGGDRWTEGLAVGHPTYGLWRTDA